MPTINNTALEKTFSDLAYAHLRDKAQGLLDYLVGFQMLKQEDEGARAVGIFGFEIDGDYYYAPAFFLNGEIRGLESIYSVKSDVFMPLTDGWVNQLINRRQQRLGEADSRSRSERGVRVPNYTRLKVLPSGGAGSAGGVTNLKLGGAGLSLEDCLKTAAAMLVVPDYAKSDLPDVLNEMGLAGIYKSAMDTDAGLRQAFNTFYSVLSLKTAEANSFVTQEDTALDPAVACKFAMHRAQLAGVDLSYGLVDTMRQQFEALGGRAKTAAEEPVIIVSQVTDDGVDRLTDAQRKEIMAGGMAVIDDRPEVSKARLYRTDTVHSYSNPERGGLYEVLWADGTTGLAVITWANTTKNIVVVVRDSDRKHCTIDARCVTVITQYSDSDYRKWLDENTSPAEDVRTNESGIFLSADGQSTGGLCVNGTRRGLDGITVASVRDHYCMEAIQHNKYDLSRMRGNNGDPHPNMYQDMYIGGNGLHEFPAYSNRPTVDPNARVEEVVIVDRGNGAPRYTLSTVIVGRNHFRWLELNKFTEPTKDTAEASLSPAMPEKYDTPLYDALLKASDFGCYNTIVEAMEKVGSDLLVWKTGSELNIRLGEQNPVTCTKVAAMRYLMKDLDLGETDSRAVIDGAHTFTTRFKYAATTKFAAELIQLPNESENDLGGGFMSAFHPQQVPFRQDTKGQPPNNREYYAYNSPFGGGAGDAEPNTTQVVDKAVQTGQKDVFDAAALASLIRSHTPTEMVDRFLPTITAGMDRMGRMLFLIYWHYDDFEERYGEQDLSEFIDNLRSVFEQMGDVVVFARRRQLSGDPDHYGLETQPVLDGAAQS